MSVLASEHRDRQFPERSRVDGNRAFCCSLKRKFRIPDAVEPDRSVTKDSRVLFEINTDPAEKDFVIADIRFIGESRGIKWQENYLMPQLEQLRRECIVAQATPAIHPCSSRCQIKYSHII